MTFFQALSWCFCLTTSGVLAWVVVKRRFLLIKPTIVVLIAFNLRIQWPAALRAEEVLDWLNYPWNFFILAQVFPLVTLLLSLLSFRQSARTVFDAAVSWRRERLRLVPFGAIVLLALATGLILLWYVAVVPLANTGLYAILVDPLRSDQAREDSLTLAGGVGFGYAVNLMMSVFAPLLAVLLVMRLTSRWRPFRPATVVSHLLAIACILIVVSITGERSRTATICLAISYGLFFSRGAAVNPMLLGGAFFATLTLPTLLSLLREGQVLSIDSFTTYFGWIVGRGFSTTMTTGLWHVYVAQTFGYFGVQGEPKLAWLLGLEPIDVSNEIALHFLGASVQTAAANTCYVFAYFSYYGIWAALPSLIVLLSLDAVLLAYRRMRGAILIACLATASVAIVKVTDTRLTTAMVTHGFLVAIASSWILNRLTTNDSARTLRAFSNGRVGPEFDWSRSTNLSQPAPLFARRPAQPTPKAAAFVAVALSGWMIVIVDYGMGNVGSILTMSARLERQPASRPEVMPWRTRTRLCCLAWVRSMRP